MILRDSQQELLSKGVQTWWPTQQVICAQSKAMVFGGCRKHMEMT
jgi:hypothetical protein